MSTITGGGATTYINAGSVDAAAQALAAQISAGLANGSLTRTNGPNPPTGAGVLTITTPGNVISDQYAVKVDVIAAGTGSTSVIGAGGLNQIGLGDNENITYFTNGLGGGPGQFVFGDGNDLFGESTVGGGGAIITLGAGNDTVNLYSGNNTLSAGAGSTTVNTGAAGTFSNNLIFNNGSVRVVSSGGTGTDVVIGGNGPTFISDGGKNVVFNGQGGAGAVTVIGGTASDVVVMGSGGGVAGGGTAGNSVLFGGTGTAGSTLFGGGNGDILFARGPGQTTLVAGPGNETLQGGASTGNNIYIAGAGGNTTIGGGAGSEVYYIGTPGTSAPGGGSVVLNSGLGNDIISFTNRGSGNTESVLINNFVASDRIQLLGFGGNTQQSAITSAAAGAGSVTLTDGTKITFGTAVNLNSSNFA